VPLSRINYFTTLPKPARWGVYLDDGRRWEALLDGTELKQVA
jgi:hypothetical protein